MPEQNLMAGQPLKKEMPFEPTRPLILTRIAASSFPFGTDMKVLSFSSTARFFCFFFYQEKKKKQA